MAPVKSKVVDTSATTPAAFLSSGGPVTDGPSSVPQNEVQPLPVASTPAPIPPVPEVTQIAELTQDPAIPVRPGLEAPAIPALAPTPDPFVLLKEWSTATTKRTLRALEVPGGCIVRVSAAIPGNLSEAICFVPGVKVENGKFVSA